MNDIKKLDTHLINQIAAGEVVDSPASILKELIENSIDAKSTTIKIHIYSGGKDKIIIKDNGIGISTDNLDLAFEPGKFLVSEAGFFITTVNSVKQTTSTVFAQINSGFNHFIKKDFILLLDIFVKLTLLLTTEK